MAITKFEQIQSLFVGQGDIVLFGDPETGVYFADGKDYSNATIADFINPKSLGQIVEDSTSWTGDDVSFEDIRDEQGDVITSTTTAGTLGFEFDIASVSADMVARFMKGTKFASIEGSKVFDGTGATVSGVGFGVGTPVITAPIAWLNDEKTRMLFFPKAKIAANFSNSDKLMRIHVVVTAEQVDTANLKTAMLLTSTVAATGGEE